MITKQRLAEIKSGAAELVAADGIGNQGHAALELELVAEIERLSGEFAEAQASIERYASKCICVFCRTEYLKTDVEGLTNHIMSCDKSPLVQMVNEAKPLIEELTTELKASEGRGDRLISDVAELNQRNIDMREAYEAKDVAQVQEIHRLKTMLREIVNVMYCEDEPKRLAMLITVGLECEPHGRTESLTTN